MTRVMKQDEPVENALFMASVVSLPTNPDTASL